MSSPSRCEGCDGPCPDGVSFKPAGLSADHKAVWSVLCPQGNLGGCAGPGPSALAESDTKAAHAVGARPRITPQFDQFGNRIV